MDKQVSALMEPLGSKAECRVWYKGRHSPEWEGSDERVRSQGESQRKLG